MPQVPNEPNEERDENETPELPEPTEETLSDAEVATEMFNTLLVETGEFVDTYGFEHECRCAADWQEGNFAVVTECYIGLCGDALETCRRMKGELAERDRELARLRTQLAGLGEEPVV